MIEIKNIVKKYLSKKKIETSAINNINLFFQNDGMVFVIGKTGCGKTTLLNMIGRLDEVTSGDIIVDNENITQFSFQESEYYRNYHIGFIFQEYNLIEEFTVYDNLSLIYKLQNRKVEDEEIEDLLKRFGLIEHKNKYCDELSGGQKQRVAIIRAIIKKAKIILADEPTGSLDDQTGIEILNILKELSKTTLVIIVTHNIEFAQKYGDRIIEMSNGKIISDTLKNHEKIIKKDSQKEEKRKSKNHLTFKDSFKFSLLNFNHKIKRLLIVLFVLIISFTLVGISSTFLIYNPNEIVIQSMQKDELKQIYVTKEEYIEYYTDNSYPSISTKDINSLIRKYNQEFYPTFQNDCTDFINNLATFDLNQDRNHSFFLGTIKNELEIDENIANNLKLKLLDGAYPNNDDEILISDYIYLHFKEYGYKGKEGNQNITTYNDIKNKIMQINNKSYKIVGIIDTNFDENRYQKLKNTEQTEDTTITNLKFELIENITYTLSGCIFHPVGFFENYIHKNYLEEKRIDTPVSLSLYQNKEDTKYIFTSKSYASINHLQEEINYKKGYENKKLEDDEIIINWEYLSNYYIENDSLKNKVQEFVYNYKNQENYEQTEIYQYYANLYYDGKISSQEFTDLTEWGIENIFLKQYFDEYIFNDLDEIYLKASNLNTKKEMHKKLKVVGYFNPSPLNNQTTGVYISKNFFDEYNNYFDLHYYNGCFTSIGNNKQILRDLQKDDIFLCFNHYISNINRISNTLETISKIIFWVGLIFIVFSASLFYSYIRFIIDDKRKQIGVLVSLGASRKDIFSIFIIESLIITGIVSIISIILSNIITNIFNTIFIRTFGALLMILSFNIVSILIIFGSCSLIAFISTYISTKSFTYQNPIHIIKTSNH